MQRRDFLRVGVGTAGLGVVGTNDTAARDADGIQEEYGPYDRLDLEAAYEVVVSDDGRIAYVATGVGYAIVDVSDPTDLSLLASRTDLLSSDDDDPLDLIWDVAVDGDRLLVVGPAHGHSAASAALLVDVSDPADPRREAAFRTAYPIHNAALAGTHAFLTANDGDRNPVVVVDFDGADGPEEVTRWSVLDRDSGWDEVHASLRVVHDVQVVDDVAYLAYWDAGTHLLDVSNPAAPEHVGAVTPNVPDELADLTSEEVRVQQQSVPGNHHNALPSEDGELLAINVESWAVEVDGDLVGDPGGVHLFDVSDRSSPERLATVDAPSTPDPTIEGVWSTSHNFDLRGDRLYTSWYEAGVQVHDVSDPADPTPVARWRDPVDASFWSAQVGVPGEFFVASSTGHRPTQPALYTFPDRAGEQASPPSMEDALDAREGSETPTETSTPSPAPSPSATDDRSLDEKAPEDDAADDDAVTEESTSGFGLGAAATAVGGVAWWTRRHGADDAE